MIRSQHHRGPDGDGIFAGPGFEFGHNRLAILDLSENGHQPMELALPGDQKLVLTYNGEIYNYLEIRRELESLGHRFRSGTDSEVLLHSYQEWGDRCLSRFNGMFAFVIYDSRASKLFGARDRFGVKPLHLRETSEAFIFASELKAIFTVDPVKTVDRQTLVDYLYSGHLHHSGRTFFEGFRELKPGHFFRYDLRTHHLQVETWYDLREEVDRKKGLTYSMPEAQAELRKLLEESIRLRLRSDVRVGTCLSGGVDSSSIAALAAKFYERGPFIGITSESLDPETNEVEFARAVAESAKLEWHRVRPEDFRDRVEDVIRTQDEPFGGLSVFMQDAVMREARRLGVPVLLDGQGGDEVFLGYPKYRQGEFFPPAKLLAKKIATVAGWIEKREFATELEALYPSEMEESRRHLLEYREALSHPRDAQILDITKTNLPQLLRYEDRNSMHHSIETRLPFLDFRLVEFGLNLDFDLKIQGANQKVVLRNAMRDVVPSRVLNRTDKIGFAAPDRAWAGAIQSLWEQPNLLKDGMAGLGIETLLDLEKPISAASRWKLINLAIWFKSYFI